MASPSIQEHFLKLSPLLHVSLGQLQRRLLWAALCLAKIQAVIVEGKGRYIFGGPLSSFYLSLIFQNGL